MTFVAVCRVPTCGKSERWKSGIKHSRSQAVKAGERHAEIHHNGNERIAIVSPDDVDI